MATNHLRLLRNQYWFNPPKTKMKRDAIDIIPYQEIWLEQFKEAKADLSSALGKTSLCIEHIGSTSIQNMPSKDRIDIQIGVNEISGEICEVINSATKGFGFSNAYLSKDHLPPNEFDEEEWRKIYLQGGLTSGTLKLTFIFVE